MMHHSEALVTDGNFFLESLNSSLFPGVSSSIKAHNGFQDEQAKTAPLVLAAVKDAMSRYSTKSVTIVGHSLGKCVDL